MTALRALACLVACLAVACSSDSVNPTQIIAIVDSDLEVPAALDRVTIDVDRVQGMRSAAADLTELELPRSLTLVHSGGPLGPIRVLARGYSGSRAVVERLAIVRFERGASLELRLPLSAACAAADLSCDDDETCELGACASAVHEELPSFRGTVRGFEVGDAGIATDAGDNAPPECTISAPSDGATFAEGDAIELTGSCEDPESGAIRAGLSWESSRGGTLGSGARVSVTTLATGEHEITLCARDPQQASLRGCTSITITVGPEIPVTATITSLSQGARTTSPFDSAGALRATGTGAGVAPLRLRWSDSIVGPLGEGESINVASPPKGKHVWTLTVTDARGNTATDTRSFVVQDAGAPLIRRLGESAMRFDVLAAASNDRVFTSGRPRRIVYTFDGSNPAIIPSTALDENQLPDEVRDISLDETLRFAYLATEGYLVCRFDLSAGIRGDQCTEFRGGMLPTDDCNAVSRVTGSDATHYLLVGTSRGLFVTTPDSSGNGNPSGNRRLNNIDIRAITQAGDGAWLATAQGLYAFDPVSGMSQRYAAASGAPSDNLVAIASSEGAIWVGSPNGLGRFDLAARSWTLWRAGGTPAPGLASDDVRDVAVARTRAGSETHDVIWIATASGVSRLDPALSSFATFTRDDGLPNSSVRAIAVLSDGTKVFATDQGLAAYDGL